MGLQREYLEYMGSVLAIFPLTYGFIIVKICIAEIHKVKAVKNYHYHLILSIIIQI